eukprot:4889068-Amphidinium_carterae.1
MKTSQHTCTEVHRGHLQQVIWAMYDSGWLMINRCFDELAAPVKSPVVVLSIAMRFSQLNQFQHQAKKP